MSITIKKIIPIIDYDVRQLCTNPYPGHPKGCPNYNKKKRCPPQAKFFEDVFDIDKPIYAIINTFDLESHIGRMRAKHPEWSPRQLKNCYYWQHQARKGLKQGIITFLKEHRDYHVTACPEGMGMNVTKTLENIGIHLQWPPETVTYQVAVVGIRKRPLDNEEKPLPQKLKELMD